MASIGTEPNGHRRILFVAADGSRKTVRLGKCSQRDAEQVCRHVEVLAAATIHGQPVARETAVWLSSISHTLYDRLARTGLVEPRAAAVSTKLGPFIDEYIAGRVDTKPRTIINLKQARKAIVNYFGEGKVLETITPGEADAFRLSLLGKGLADNTVRRICGRSRQFFRAAIRLELTHRNPFDGIKCAVGANTERLYFVSRQEAEKVLEACPDAEWRLIFSLSRFAGMRCPSEHLALRWSDVDWEHNRMTVRSPKTEHYVGKASRLVPIFPELRPHLLAAFELAVPGAEYVITRCRDGSVNLRTQLERIIQQAGLKPWPKLFHNLRATRETELAESFPLHVVCAWIGNSQAIAAKHYLQVTDEHFDRAINEGMIGRAGKTASQVRGETDRAAAPSGTEKTIFGAAQNPAQQLHAQSRKASQVTFPKTHNPWIYNTLREDAKACNRPNKSLMPPLGLEPRTH
ncbi:MAG: site-specific integrase [Phycisphaerae bacterium]|nr:site-specific integrase [Phycisphaerae bacterium]